MFIYVFICNKFYEMYFHIVREFFSDYLKIFDGNGTLQYYHSGCWSSIRRSLVEVPFLSSKDITVSIYLNWLGSFVKVRYAILRDALDSGTY